MSNHIKASWFEREKSCQKRWLSIKMIRYCTWAYSTWLSISKWHFSMLECKLEPNWKKPCSLHLDYQGTYRKKLCVTLFGFKTKPQLMPSMGNPIWGEVQEETSPCGYLGIQSYNICQNLNMWRRALKHWRWLRMGVTSSRTVIQNTPPKGRSVVFWQQHHSLEMACPIPWFKSYWTPLATSQDQTPAIWYTTQRSAWLVG